MLLAGAGYKGMPQRPAGKLTHPLYGELHCLGNAGRLVSSGRDVF